MKVRFIIIINFFLQTNIILTFADALHKSRLLNVEEKPFKRISKLLLNPDSLIVSPPIFLPTPPPGDEQEEEESSRQKKLETWRNFRDNVALDFSIFEGNIAYMQFSLTCNELERQRYAAEKLRILSIMQSVRDNTNKLRDQLEEAQRILALRKTYDELTERITSNRLLKPREEQAVNLAKLQAEIVDLQRESEEYAKTWRERREQFGRIVDEGMQLRRLIRDEKEEVERREGMQDGEMEDSSQADVSKSKSSGANTPRPEEQQQQQQHSSLQVEKPSVVTETASPLRQVTTAADDKKPLKEDSTTADEGEVTEEGEEPDNRAADQMDTT